MPIPALVVSVLLNGSPVNSGLNSGLPPVIEDGSVEVHLRPLLEKMGAKVDYEYSGTVWVEYNGRRINLTQAYQAHAKRANRRQSLFRWVGISIAFAPVRFLGEVIGFPVQWDNEHKAVIINTR